VGRMARPLRIERRGGWYHVTSRGNERKPIYRDIRDREHFLAILAEMADRFRVRLHGYVLMDNHYHLVVELTERNLSRSVQWLNVSYSVWFNRRHSRSGHLFQGRFRSVTIAPEEWGLALSRYVHLNPVRVRALGLGKADRAGRRVGLAPAPDAARVRERTSLLRRYRWSSYWAYVGLEPVPEWLVCQAVLALGGGARTGQRRRYREYVEAAVRDGLEASPWESLREQVVLGSAEFLARLREHVHGDEQEQRGARRLLSPRPTFAAVIGAIERVKGRRWEEFRDQYGDPGRDMALHLGRRLCGLKLTELSREAGLPNYAVVATGALRYARRLAKDRAERRRVAEVIKLLNGEM